MHLKSLTLKGFKSFASATTLRLEPGITASSGPNGSGKSNVVDAIAWVLGEQGAKALRGGKMEDVIFAGTAGRPPLGRAEVTLTIDNTDGALPIDYTEVSITRRMFRSGESEYEINGDSCRLLDIQELLSDSGIGREMHVIVGQGQLDAVLHAKPGGPARVHRGGRRRPQAPQAQGEGAPQARRDAGQPQPARPTSPPSCAASSSRWAGRPRWPAGPPASRPTCATPGCGCSPTTWPRCATTLDREVADETALRERRERGRGASSARSQRAAGRLEAALAADAPLLAARPGHLVPAVRAAGAVPRASHQLAAERLPAPGRRAPTTSARAATPTQLDAEAERVREQEARAARRRWPTTRRGSPTRSSAARSWSGAGRAERALVAAARAIADRREGLARLSGQVDAARGRADRRRRARSTGSPPRSPRPRSRAEAAAGRAATRPRAELDRGRPRTTPSWTPRHADAVAAHDRGRARRSRS